MATQTSKLKLTKPAYTDTADIQVVNVNMDIVDSEFVKVDGELKKVNDRVTVVENTVSNIKLEAKNVSIDDVSNKFTSTNVEGALKEVMEKSEQAFQLGVSTKSEMKNAINSKKTVSDVTDNDSWSTYVQRVKDIKEGSGNATVGDVLSGKTFTNNDGVEYTGTMANQPASVSAISVGSDGTNKYFRIPNGAYLTNTQTGYPEIVASATQIDSNIKADNILNTVSICGVKGNIPIMGHTDCTGVALWPNKDLAVYSPRGFFTGNTGSELKVTQAQLNSLGYIKDGKRFASGSQGIGTGSVPTLRIHFSLSFNPSYVFIMFTGKLGFNHYGGSHPGEIEVGNLIISNVGKCISTSHNYSFFITNLSSSGCDIAVGDSSYPPYVCLNGGTAYWYAFS